MTTTTTIMDLRTSLNSCKPANYTRISDLQDNAVFLIRSFEKVATPYGDAILAILEGIGGDDPTRIYLPRRFKNVLTDSIITQYNAGSTTRLHLVKKAPLPGSNNHQIEFV